MLKKKTLLVDFNNVAMMKIFNNEVNITTENPDYDMWKFLVFETIYDYIYKFKGISEVILAKDAPNTWRKDCFSRYKEKRLEKKKDDNIDWNAFYSVMNEFFIELSLFFPFKCIEVKKCEGDDLIGILSRKIRNQVIILSSDGDFKQLITNDVKLYSLRRQEYLECENTVDFVFKSALIGQTKDGIFSVIVPENWPNDIRKPGFGIKKAEKLLKEDKLDDFLDKEIQYKKKNKDGIEYIGCVIPRERLDKNLNLIDFYRIPDIIQDEICDVYDKYILLEQRFYEYFEKNNWRKFLEDFNNVENILMKLF